MPLNVVTSLKPATNSDVIATLEEALELARAGEVTAVAVAMVMKGGGMSRGWSNCDPVAPLVGAVSYLQHDLIASSE
jgi:hypothetical protein